MSLSESSKLLANDNTNRTGVAPNNKAILTQPLGDMC